jgi:hypothetical protein
MQNGLFALVAALTIGSAIGISTHHADGNAYDSTGSGYPIDRLAVLLLAAGSVRCRSAFIGFISIVVFFRFNVGGTS